jgi:ATP-dependent helicase HrpA
MLGVNPGQIDRRRMNPQQHRYSAAELELRRAACPKPTYPEELPVSARRADIAQAIEKHQVAISGRRRISPQLISL